MKQVNKVNKVNENIESGYRVWADSESEVYIKKDFHDADEAYDFAVEFVHRYDGEPFRVICHVEDLILGETIETVENEPEFGGMNESRGRNVVRLNESQLRRIVKESVKKVLKEYNETLY